VSDSQVSRVSAATSRIAAAVREGDQLKTVTLVRDAVAADIPPLAVLSEGLVVGIQATGELFKDGQAFLPEIMISARALQAGVGELRLRLEGSPAPIKGRVVIGTAAGDLHSIGKDLVALLLDCNGFEVADLGVDVSAQAFAQAAEAHEADLVAISALLTTTTPEFRTVMEELARAGLRGRTKIMVGGAPVTWETATEAGADGFAADCVAAVEEAERLLSPGEYGPRG